MFLNKCNLNLYLFEKLMAIYSISYHQAINQIKKKCVAKINQNY